MPFDLSVPLQYHGLLSTVGIRDIVDILLVAVILYKSYEMLKDTRAITLAKGLFVMMGVACLWLCLLFFSQNCVEPWSV